MAGDCKTGLVAAENDKTKKDGEIVNSGEINKSMESCTVIKTTQSQGPQEKPPKGNMNGVEGPRTNSVPDEVHGEIPGATDGTFVRLCPPIGLGDCSSTHKDFVRCPRLARTLSVEER